MKDICVMMTVLHVVLGDPSDVSSWIPNGGSLYYVSGTTDDGRKSWEAAQSVCKEVDSHLVSINTEEENNFLSQYRKTYMSFWINLRVSSENACDTCKQIPDSESCNTCRTNWQWMDDSTVRYQNWYASQPNELLAHCAVLSDGGYWYDEPCNSTMFYICERADKHRCSEENKHHYCLHDNCNNYYGSLMCSHYEGSDENIYDKQVQSGNLIAWIFAGVVVNLIISAAVAIILLRKWAVVWNVRTNNDIGSTYMSEHLQARTHIPCGGSSKQCTDFSNAYSNNAYSSNSPSVVFEIEDDYFHMSPKQHDEKGMYTEFTDYIEP